MRPLTLQLKGFTSFRDEQELDFRTLDVFAVTGPTGAGKSSLLDAMTYALYGQVERVGNQCAQLVSHGASRLAVSLTFEVNGREFRITRSTPASKGATKVLLERCENGEWRSYGEGADRVTEANRYVEDLIGLDYKAFTRSVLLPQGKFAEFMTGKPDERRALLSDLLGLELFGRMAQRSGRLATDAESEGKIKDNLLHSQYADVTPEAVMGSLAAADQSAARLAALDNAIGGVEGILTRWRAEQARRTEVQACAAELRSWRARLATAVSAAGALAHEARESEQAVAAAEARVADAQAAAATALEQRTAAEAMWGTPLELSAALPVARGLPARYERLTARQHEIDALTSREPAQQARLAAACVHSEQVDAAVRCAEIERDRARLAVREAQHAHMAATLATGLQIGDPCPVCGDPLERQPEVSAPRELTEADTALKAAEQTLAAAESASRDARQMVERVEREIAEDVQTIKRLHAELAVAGDEVHAVEREVAAALREPLSGDPASILDQRLAALSVLARHEQSAGAEFTRAVQAQAAVVHSAGSVLARLAAQRVTIVDPSDTLFARIAVCLGVDRTPDGALHAPDSADDLVAHGTARLELVDARLANLDRAVDAIRVLGVELLQAAHAIIGELLPAPPSLTDAIEQLHAARLETVARHAEAVQRAEILAQMLSKRTVLEAEIGQHRAQAGNYRSLATDLRGDHLIAFLQDEALVTLAQVGSRHLKDLSGQRYELCVDGDFYVIDRWAADERRSVRTLSGGETFLASLALALALSEQVRALSVTDGARLDSLFLDEGFGTLDPETLQTVVDAIERLSDGGRLIGIITHVPELADSFQKIAVTKTPRGSHLQLAA